MKAKFGLVLGLASLSGMSQESATAATGDAAKNVAVVAAPAQPARTVSVSAPVATLDTPEPLANAVNNVAFAATPSQPASSAAAMAALPEGVVTESNPMKLAYIARTSKEAAFFRPSPNMPEIVNEEMLRGYAEGGKAVKHVVTGYIGYMPKLKVLPCPVGCEGEAYEKAVAQFIDGYEGDGGIFRHRGEMIVQVRWFHARPWYARAVPVYGTDYFGVEFMLEGKVVSIGKQSLVAKAHTQNASELAHDVGARIGIELMNSLALGAKPDYLDAANNVGKGFAGAIGNVNDAIGSALGGEDVRARIEPATDANNNLLPAIDGIGPNEIEPITAMHYIYYTKF
ncbi:hypothetical protein AWB79_05729 [Caballeronia hypogeia]|uniref:Lipoprotein n=1 Tax=Caballeronia hypogeia TaxID=1777140 RepID=A0A158CP96_9BURK|nr:hypothetical protein [Caballeronia hypogeia]SAK84173.1 hypothetical protein AWB79_05729 [Caballeronia hypogeia]